jgi:hypothetical protein
MYFALAVHRPKGTKEEALLVESMKRFGEEQRKYKGLIFTAPIKDSEAGVLIGLSIWDTKENFDAAWKELSKTRPERRARDGFRFEDVETEPHQFYSGEPAAWG